ncbi:MAG: hypothetical protein KME06_09485 [Kastovskya adunca ATA6-11-RM4]|nr:hypothetical protein [Kastovskya adunca ATA6-11-RM4]
MDYKDAIAALADFDDADDIIKAIQGKVSGLLADQRKLEQQNQKLETLTSHILEASGAEGEDFEAKLQSSANKVKVLADDLKQVRTQVEQAEAAKKEAETKLTQAEKRSLIQSAASKSGAVAEVLEQLLTGCSDELAIADNNSVTVGGKALREYAEASATWKPFLPALFHTTKTQLPSGSASGKASTDPIGDYLTNNYTVPDYLKA